MLSALPYPLHPMIIHFPIALFITSLLLELLHLTSKKDFFHQSALTIYVLAALLTPLVFRTGLWEAEKLNLVSHPVLDQHRLFANWIMWFSLMSLPVMWYSYKESPKIFKWIFIFILIGAVCFVSLTGHFGGRMVYEYGVGIDL